MRASGLGTGAGQVRNLKRGREREREQSGERPNSARDSGRAFISVSITPRPFSIKPHPLTHYSSPNTVISPVWCLMKPCCSDVTLDFSTGVISKIQFNTFFKVVNNHKFLLLIYINCFYPSFLIPLWTNELEDMTKTKRMDTNGQS